jgi:hypothetical protein
MNLDKHIKNAKTLTTLMDTKFSLFGIRFGLDPLLDFIPGLGSILGAFTSCYIVWIAAKLNVPGVIYFKMVMHILLDLLVSEIPFVGVIFDVFYKSNKRNLELVLPYYKSGIMDAEIVG